MLKMRGGVWACRVLDLKVGVMTLFRRAGVV